ncbi:MAG: sigma-70 family RNA polymerase sigma factor [Gemmataceae bacterium]|nr:sigma-70 family RNA polymerase sigma factor [Gemmataceae bacterium]
MSGEHVSLALRHIRHLLGARRSDQLGDRQLLERFSASHDESAFAILVQRHGALVLSVCRRVLLDVHHAEDAFQATFIILASRPKSIRNPDSLPSWLYGVAYRVASKLRTRLARSRSTSEPAPEPAASDTTTDVTWRDLRAAIDEELNRLPEKYRAPLLMCYLEDRTQDEAAEQLGWNRGTLKRRLDRGRELLRGRLARRGLALSAAPLSMALGANATAGILAPRLLAATLQTAATFAADPKAVSSSIATLVAEAMTTMTAMRLKLYALALLAVAALGIGSMVVIDTTAATPESTALTAVMPAGRADSLPNRLLAIGVHEYIYAEPVSQATGNSALHTVVDDMAAAWQIEPGQVTLLSDAAPAPRAFPPLKSVIQQTMAEFLDGCRPQDRAVVLFVGHAVDLDGEAYLVPIEGELSIGSTLVPLAWVYERLAACRARQKLLVLDVCRYDPMDAALHRALQSPPPGVQVWSACAEAQFSHEVDGTSLFLDQLARATRQGELTRGEMPLSESQALSVNERTRAMVRRFQFTDQLPSFVGAEAESVLVRSTDPLPPAIALKLPSPFPDGIATRAQVQRILDVAAAVPPALVHRSNERRLKAGSLPVFSAEQVARYAPDEADSALRQAVRKAIGLLGKHRLKFPDQFQAPAAKQLAEFRQEIEQIQRTVAETHAEFERSLTELNDVRDDRNGETPHWQANYDYVKARLLGRIAFVYEYNASLAKLRKDDMPTLDRAELHNGWRLISRRHMTDREAHKIAEEARLAFRKLAQDHQGTPWEVLGKREIAVQYGLDWQPAKLEK